MHDIALQSRWSGPSEAKLPLLSERPLTTTIRIDAQQCSFSRSVSHRNVATKVDSGAVHVQSDRLALLVLPQTNGMEGFFSGNVLTLIPGSQGIELHSHAWHATTSEDLRRTLLCLRCGKCSSSPRGTVWVIIDLGSGAPRSAYTA